MGSLEKTVLHCELGGQGGFSFVLVFSALAPRSVYCFEISGWAKVNKGIRVVLSWVESALESSMRSLSRLKNEYGAVETACDVYMFLLQVSATA